MRLRPVPIPSDASKSPLLPGLSLEWGDLIALIMLLSPALLLTNHRVHGAINFTLVILSAIPGLLLSIPLIFAPPTSGQRGWARLLAWAQFTFMSRRQWRTTAIYADNDSFDWGVKACGKAEKIDYCI